MNAQAEIGRVAGIPVLVNVSFVLLVVLWGQAGLTSGKPGTMLHTFVVIAALAASIILHELGHAFAGRLFRVNTQYVELHGYGGVCVYGSGQPKNRMEELTMVLAGPLANLVIYAVCDGLIDLCFRFSDYENASVAMQWVLGVLFAVKSANFAMFWFNLLPAHPLDGGKALAILLRSRTDGNSADIAVAWCGIAVAALLIANYGLSSAFTTALALMLGYQNYEILSRTGRPPWKMWD
jgi:Zn-dependent protease